MLGQEIKDSEIRGLNVTLKVDSITQH